jgi:hypothetical protein
MAMAAVPVAAAELEWLAPSTVILQAGAAEDTESYSVGATWDVPWQREFAGGVLSAYFEGSVGRWLGEDDGNGRSSAWVTQLGVTPVFRFYPDALRRTWFLEAGIGVNVVTPIYRSEDKSFSTAFNFGDHLAVGWRFGHAGSQEVALRVQHFSNAGIKHPNPGENFLQLRYSRRFNP